MYISEKMKTALKSIRSEYPSYIALRRINGKYYVYHDKRPWDKIKHKQTTVSEYLGRLTEDGVFIRKSTSKDADLENAKSLILSRGGKVLFPEIQESEKLEEVITPSELDKKILTILSMNGRASYKFIGKLTGLDASTVYNKVRNIEKKYGIKYLAELEIQKLGYLSYIVLVKFLGNEMPTTNDIKTAFESEPSIQLALLTKGNYDIILYVLSKDNEKISEFPLRVQTSKVFKNYRSKWYVTPCLDVYCFIPLRDKFFELLQNEITIKSRKQETKGNLTNREIIVLKELCNDGSIDLLDIDRRNNLDSGAAQYTYHKLIKKGIIRRITINETGFRISYNAIIKTEIFDGEQAEKNRPHFLSSMIEETGTAINKYAFAARISIPEGTLLIMPISNNNTLEKAVDNIKENTKGFEVLSFVITNVLIGNLCYRNFDNAYSRQYELLVSNYKVTKPKDRTSYIDYGSKEESNHS